MIEIKNLSKTFSNKGGKFTALKNINLTINDGEIFGIIGLSGAGKSTLVRCINFLERPDSGQVLIDGVDLGTLKKKELLKLRQNIGMIFQGFNLLSQRTVIGNICYPLEIAGVKKGDAIKRAEELLELVGMADKAKSYPSQLSGGQKQRVAIARAIAAKTKYLLCDEATSALDPDTTQSILDLMQKINRELGVTIIVITHEMSVIDRICDRVAVIDKSEIQEIGDVSTVFSNPQSDIAKKLILPRIKTAEEVTGHNKIRIVFNGESSFKPVIANMVLEIQEPVNILHAETENVDGKAYGQMIIQLPDSEKSINRIMNYLNENNISFSRLDEDGEVEELDTSLLSQLWEKGVLQQGIWETIYMTFISTFFAYLIGLPLGVILVVTAKDGIRPIGWLNKILDVLVNIFRSIPFIILMVAMLPVVKVIIGKSLGNGAMIVTLILAAIPYVARMAESSIKEVDKGVIEAAQAMGTSSFGIIRKVLIPEAKPSLIVGAVISLVTILGYSAMAGTIGGGGLGMIAINYGYQRFDDKVVWICVLLTIVIVQLIQEFGMLLARKTDKRINK